MKLNRNRILINRPLVLLILLLPCILHAQQDKEKMVRKIYDQALTQSEGYEWLHFMCKNIGHRLIGSAQAQETVELTKKWMEESGFDTVWLQPTTVRNWQRGKAEKGSVRSRTLGKKELHLCSLGGSVATPAKGLKAEVIEVDSLSQLALLGKEKITGKIVFFNRPMDPRYPKTGQAYGKATDQRVYGAREAAKYGAVGALTRSLTLAKNTFPHTGIMRYDFLAPKIPALAIATEDADLLSDWIRKDPHARVSIYSFCSTGDSIHSFNVIGEVRGNKYPESVILAGGHLDSWDLGEGAHDDGIGCVQSIQAIKTLKSIGYRPNYTLRCVLFMDEEMDQSGGKRYAAWSKETNQKHLIAIELDAGGSTPTGFSMTGDSLLFTKITSVSGILAPYGLFTFQKGGGGVDISFLKELGVPQGSMSNFSQNYFDYHHSALDIFENVNQREMQLGIGGLATIIFLLDQE